jgi:hypothetical protein
MDWILVLVCVGFWFGGLALGVVGMEWFVVTPLRKAVLNMRIMGFDPHRQLPVPKEDEFVEYNET